MEQRTFQAKDQFQILFTRFYFIFLGILKDASNLMKSKTFLHHPILMPLAITRDT